MLHETEDQREVRRHVREGCGGDINGDGFLLRGVWPGDGAEDVQAQNLDIEGDVNLGGEVLEVVASEAELELVVSGRRSENGDFERKGCGVIAEGELLHEGGPLAAVADVEIDDVEAMEALEGLEEGLVGGEVGELENGRDLGEGFVGGDLEDEGVRV